MREGCLCGISGRIGHVHAEVLYLWAWAESVQTINQLLTEMDGFDDNTGVVVMAATNRPAALDSALTRPGRFDRVIHLPLPNLEVREHSHVKKKELRVVVLGQSLGWVICLSLPTRRCAGVPRCQ